MKPNNNNNQPKEPRTTRPISPSFRSGPRQRPSDASTDEIVRFVREHQRYKPPQPVHNVSALKAKAVLPSIERKRTDIRNFHDKRASGFDEENNRHSFESTKDMDAEPGYSEITERGLEDTEYDYDQVDLIGNKSNDFQKEMDFIDDKMSTRRKYAQNDVTQKRHSKHEVNLDVDRLLARSNNSYRMIHSDKRGSVNAHTNFYSHKNDLTSSSADQSFLQSGRMRPTALRQLPPIINKETETEMRQGLKRPSAPSPDRVSPGLRSVSDHSSVDDDDDECDDDEEYDDIEDDEFDGTGGNGQSALCKEIISNDIDDGNNSGNDFREANTQ